MMQLSQVYANFEWSNGATPKHEIVPVNCIQTTNINVIQRSLNHSSWSAKYFHWIDIIINHQYININIDKNDIVYGVTWCLSFVVPISRWAFLKRNCQCVWNLAIFKHPLGEEWFCLSVYGLEMLTFPWFCL